MFSYFSFLMSLYIFPSLVPHEDVPFLPLLWTSLIAFEFLEAFLRMGICQRQLLVPPASIKVLLESSPFLFLLYPKPVFTSSKAFSIQSDPCKRGNCSSPELLCSFPRSFVVSLQKSFFFFLLICFLFLSQE